MRFGSEPGRSRVLKRKMVAVVLATLIATLAVGAAPAGAKKKPVRLGTTTSLGAIGDTIEAQVGFYSGLPAKLGISANAVARNYPFCLKNRKVGFTYESPSGQASFLGSAFTIKLPDEAGVGYGGFVYEASVPLTGEPSTTPPGSSYDSYVTKKIVWRNGRKFICTGGSGTDESFCGTQCRGRPRGERRVAMQTLDRGRGSKVAPSSSRRAQRQAL